MKTLKLLDICKILFVFWGSYQTTSYLFKTYHFFIDGCCTLVLITDNDTNDISRLNQTILAINNSTTFEIVTSLERKERDVFFSTCMSYVNRIWHISLFFFSEENLMTFRYDVNKERHILLFPLTLWLHKASPDYIKQSSTRYIW